MNRLFGLVGVLLFVCTVGSAAAQEATPTAPESFQIAPGVLADSLVFVEGSEAPLLYKLHLDPGVVYRVEPGVNLELGHLEAGSLMVTLEAPVTVARVGDKSSAGQAVPAGTAFTLTPGQYIVLQPGVGGEIRNEGTEVAILSVAAMALNTGATPVATPVATPAG